MGEQEMGKLLVYLKDYKKESVLGPLFKLLEASFELIVPLVMAAIIDHGVADGDKPYIMKMCLVLVLLAVIGLTCSITAQYLQQRQRSVFPQDCATHFLSIFRNYHFRRWILWEHPH